jgi:hypothetical protein
VPASYRLAVGEFRVFGDAAGEAALSIQVLGTQDSSDDLGGLPRLSSPSPTRIRRSAGSSRPQADTDFPRRDCGLALAREVPRRYDRAEEVRMIELTDQQVDALENTERTPLRLMNPRTKQTYVLLPVEEYERLAEDEYDDTPWTMEELQALAWEAGKSMGWDDMDEYDGAPGKP